MTIHNKRHVKIALEAIGGKWKPEILWLLRNRPYRFNELSRMIPDVSKKMLVQQLRKLEADKIVYRHVENVMPPKVEYSLTDYGQTLCPVFEALDNWGQSHLEFLQDSEDE